MTEDKKLNVALLGYPDDIYLYYLPFLNALDDKFNIKTIWRYPDYSYKEKYPYQEGIHYTEDISEILEDDSIDLVFINRRDPYDNADWAYEIIDSGKHVIIDIPFSVWPEDTKVLYKLAKKKNVLLAPLYNRRYDSDYLTVKKVIESGILGDIFEIQSNFDVYDPDRARYNEFFQKDKALIYKLGWHLFDQIIDLYDFPDYYAGEASTFIDDYTMNDFFRITLGYQRDDIGTDKPGHKVPHMTATINGNIFSVKPRPRFVIIGEKGTFIKESGDRQYEDLEKFISPEDPTFGMDLPEDYGVIYYVEQVDNYKEIFHKKRVPTIQGNYLWMFEDIYNAIVKGEPLGITKRQVKKTIKAIESFIDYDDYWN